MITIKRIEIKGFFGKGNFEWELNPVVNILGGKNGSGKSTIFKICYAMLNNKHVPASIGNEANNIFREVNMTLSNDWTLSWPYNSETLHLHLDFDGSKPMAYVEPIAIKDEKGEIRDHSELQELVKSELINSFEQHLEKAIQYWQQPKSFVLDNPTFLDLMIKDQIDKRNMDFAGTMEEFIDSSDGNVQNEYTRNYKMVYSVLNHFFDGYDKKIGSSFVFTKNGARIRYEHLSMGEKQLLLLILMVGNTKQQPCVFFMDEPDLSMHIDWKEELVTQLHEMNPNMQIILSTHAPSVITGWMDCVKEVSQLIKE